MYEAIAEQLERRIFHPRNRKLKQSMRETFNTPLFLRMEDQLVVNKRVSEVRLVNHLHYDIR